MSQQFQNVIGVFDNDEEDDEEHYTTYGSGGYFSPESYDYGDSDSNISTGSSSKSASPSIVTKPAGPVQLANGTRLNIDFDELERRVRRVSTTFFVSEYDQKRDSAIGKPFRILFVTHANHILPAVRQLAEEVRLMAESETLPVIISTVHANTIQKQELLAQTKADLAFLCVAKARKFWPRNGDYDDKEMATEFVRLLNSTNNNAVGVVMDDSSDVDTLENSQLEPEYPLDYASKLRSGFKVDASVADPNQSHIYTLPVLYLATQEVNENGNIGRRISQHVINSKNIKQINQRVRRSYEAWVAAFEVDNGSF